MDYIKSMFNNFTKKSYGQTGLPIDVENELFEENQRNTFSTKGNDQPTYHHHFDYSSDELFNQFNNMLGDFQKMTEELFGDENRIFQDESQHGHHGRLSEKGSFSDDERLRDKMFENGDQDSFDLFSFDGDKRTDDPFSSFFFTFPSPLLHLPETERNGDNYVDRDLDRDVGGGHLSIDDVIGYEKPRGEHMVSPFIPFSTEEFIASTDSLSLKSAFKYSTITKKVNPDGTVETIKKRKDSDGNEEEITSRSMDGQTHSITTKRNIHGGTEEHVENLLNMNEDDLKNFEEKWKEKKKDEATSHVLQPPSKDNKSSWWWW